MSLPFDFFVGNQNLKHEKKLNFSFSKDEHGDNQLTYSVPKIPVLPRTIVKLRDTTYGYFWSGYTWQITLDLWDCPIQVCRGMQYTSEDNGWNESKVWRAGTPLSSVVSDTLSKCSHIFDSSELPDSLSEQLPEDSKNFGLSSARDGFNFVQEAMSFFATPLQWRAATRGWDGLSKLEMEFVDYSPRYRVRLTSKDEFKPIYDADIIAQVAMISWGNDQYATAGTAGVVLNTPLPTLLGGDLPNTTIPEPIDHSVIPDMRTRRVRADNNVTKWSEASALASYLVERNKKLRPIGFTMTIDCDTKIGAVPPVVPRVTDAVPHYLVEPWHGIRILNDLRKWGPYGNIDTFYIIGINWTEDGKLQLTLGDPVQTDTFRLLSRYDGNKLGTTIGSGVINQPEKDVNSFDTVGPQFDANGKYLDNAVTAGIPTFAKDKNDDGTAKHDDPDDQFYLPFGAGVHPHEVADYGVQANFGREADSIGIKGFVGLIPVKLLNWYIAFLAPPGSDTIPTDNITLQFYDKYPFVVGTDTPFATKSIVSAKQASGNFTGAERKVFAQGGQVGVRVSAAAATVNCGFIVFLGGRKLYPDLGITS